MMIYDDYYNFFSMFILSAYTSIVIERCLASWSGLQCVTNLNVVYLRVEHLHNMFTKQCKEYCLGLPNILLYHCSLCPLYNQYYCH